MKKLVYLTLFMLFVNVLVSCAKATPERVEGMLNPGDKIGSMTVEERLMSKRYRNLADYCDSFQSFEKEPGTETIDCEVSLIPGLTMDFGWGAKDTTMLDSNWNAMTWELYIDDYQINLDAFRQWNARGPDVAGHQNVQGRGWAIDLVNLSPGKHTLRLLWTSETPIDDGFDTYAPGPHENIVNFTVPEN